ncbi:flagellin [Limnohabitans sp. Rim8]|uniref:flagellin N-terminal helical domain-containing protein n=1 Tax=Limnohabitans sp. Rim8 TaxID=1100718 RepID=UPI00262FB791|nr:flagellin [Limnohabitans sp. Rim8]
MSVINTNVKALTAQKAIQENSRALTTAMERLSSGKRINSAKDDAAGLAISTRMEAQTRGLNMAIRNANDGISLMQTGEGAMNEVTDILQRMRELAVQSVNGTNNASDRNALNDEVKQLKAEIERIATTTEFNSQKLLDGSFTGKTLQIGDKANQTLKIDIGSLKLKDLGLGSTGGGANAMVSGRTSLGAVDAGDIMINDQAIGAIVAADDLEDVINNINNNVDNVTASGFNTAVAKQIGTGVTTDGQLKISVRALGASAATTYSISASANMNELVSNINNEVGAAVQASVSEGGKLVLSNTTGATIGVVDTSASTVGSFETASGFSATTATGFTSFAGFLKLESDDGSPVRIDKGAQGTLADLETLGFRPTTSDFSKSSDAYTVTGSGLTSAGIAAAWGATDIKINGIAIHDADIVTDTFQRKLDAINNFSNETGVIASAYLDQTLTLTDAQVASAGTGSILSFNGTTVFTGAANTSVADVITAINAQKTNTGITAERTTNGVRLTGSNVQTLTIGGTATSAMASFVSGVSFASIRLDSVSNSPISIELGDNATTIGAHGFFESNVGAADYMVNGANLGVSTGSSLSGLSIATASSASAALGTIDKAMGTVSDMRSKLGAMQNRLNSTVDNLSNVVTNTEAARSRIQDTDYATETTALAKSQIIQQAATAMLAQANQQPQSVLSLLQ